MLINRICFQNILILGKIQKLSDFIALLGAFNLIVLSVLKKIKK